MPGKFNSVNDAAIYALTLDGTGESVGSVDTIGHWTRITFDEAFDYEVPFTSITRVQAGTYIVHEDSQGFIQVTGYSHDDEKDMAALEHRWLELVDEAEQWDDENEEL